MILLIQYLASASCMEDGNIQPQLVLMKKSIDISKQSRRLLLCIYRLQLKPLIRFDPLLHRQILLRYLIQNFIARCHPSLDTTQFQKRLPTLIISTDTDFMDSRTHQCFDSTPHTVAFPKIKQHSLVFILEAGAVCVPYKMDDQ